MKPLFARLFSVHEISKDACVPYVFRYSYKPYFPSAPSIADFLTLRVNLQPAASFSINFCRLNWSRSNPPPLSWLPL